MLQNGGWEGRGEGGRGGVGGRREGGEGGREGRVEGRGVNDSGEFFWLK